MNRQVVTSNMIALSLVAIGALPALAQSTLVMDRVAIRDAWNGNREAATLLVPQGWQVQGGVKWYPNTEHQACFEIKVGNPRTYEQVESLAFCQGFWHDNPVIPLQERSMYQGRLVMRPTLDPRELVRTVTLPLCRANLRPTITQYQELPQLAKTLSAYLGGVQVRSGRVRVEYNLDGQPVEEDFYVSLYVTKAWVVNGMAYNWGPAWPPIALRAAKGELDAATPKLLAIANSSTVNQQWFSEYTFVCDLFQNRVAKSIQWAGDISRTIKANSDAIFQMYSDSYWQRQASQDRLAQNYSDAFRGVARYTSPYERYPVQLPGGYSYAWASPNGQYVLTNDAGYDPNVGGTESWQQIQVAR